MIQTIDRHAMIRILTACALLALSAPVFAGDGAKEAATAATHAGFAAKSTELQLVHMHLHHAINCLVGPKGEDFDPEQADPCKGQGDGAIPDTWNPEKRKMLESALASAKQGLASDDLKAAQKAAEVTESTLRSMSM